MDALTDANRAQAIDHIKSMMSDKAYNLIDAQREAVARSLFGDVVGAEPEAEPEVEAETDETETTEEPEQPEEEQTDETDNGDD